MAEVRSKPSPSYAIPATIITLGLYRLWYARTLYALNPTTLRVESGILRRQEEEVPLPRITSVTMKLSPLPGASSVIVGTGSGERTIVVGRLNRRDARTWAAALNDARAAAS
jgi:membrane protein YdbS with pleckstrin-like domain